MNTRLFAAAICSAALIVLAAAGKPADSQAVDAAQVAHGKYLVHHVAQCIQCHTPRNSAGELIQSRLMQGAPIPVSGPSFSPPWAATSASLAGLGNYEHDFVKYLLMHGKRPDGSRPEHPMPRFRLSEEDADAVIAYLVSLHA